MTTSTTSLPAVLTVFVALLAVPVVMLGVVMPLLALVGGGGGMLGQGGMGHGPMWLLVLLPIVPVTVLTLVDAAFRRSRERRVDPAETGALAQLRAADARGDVSTEEFESRRARLVGDAEGRTGTEVADDA